MTTWERLRPLIKSAACPLSDQEFHNRAVYFISPDGKKITLADLPPSGTQRWVLRHKAIVITAVCMA
jgi:Protein of unknown function (DUF1153)